MAASSNMIVKEDEGPPIPSHAIVEAKEVDGEEVPGIDPFVAYEHASRRSKEEDIEYEITENGGIKIFYGTEYLEEDLTQAKWGFSINIEVLDGPDNDPETKDSYIEVRYNPKVEEHKNGEKIWKDIVDGLEDKTVEYHRDIKGEIHD